MTNEFRVQFENENGKPLYVAFQTTTIERANEFRNELASLSDKFGIGHDVVTREYKRNQWNGDWELVK